MDHSMLSITIFHLRKAYYVVLRLTSDKRALGKFISNAHCIPSLELPKRLTIADHFWIKPTTECDKFYVLGLATYKVNPCNANTNSKSFALLSLRLYLMIIQSWKMTWVTQKVYAYIFKYSQDLNTFREININNLQPLHTSQIISLSRCTRLKVYCLILLLMILLCRYPCLSRVNWSVIET